MDETDLFASLVISVSSLSLTKLKKSFAHVTTIIIAACDKRQKSDTEAVSEQAEGDRLELCACSFCGGRRRISSRVDFDKFYQL